MTIKAKIFTILVVACHGLLPAQSEGTSLEAVRAAFQNRMEEIRGRGVKELNEKYVAGLTAAKERAQARGDLDGAVAFSNELEYFEKESKPGIGGESPDAGLTRLREAFETELQRLESERLASFEEIRASYEQSLRSLMKELAAADKIEEALMVRDAAREAVDLKYSEVASQPVANSTAAIPSEIRIGRVRGMGRVAGMPPEALLDLSKLQQYEDYVDVVGSPNRLVFLRKNGDVLSYDGEVVGSGAEKIFPFGYNDAKGVYHPLDGKEVPAEAQPVKQVDHFGKRSLALSKSGNLVAWGGDYENGTRTVPERARTAIKKFGFHWEGDFALSQNGEVIRWDDKGESKIPKKFESGVAAMWLSYHHASVFLIEDNDLFGMGARPTSLWGTKKAKNILVGGLMWAVLDVDDRWHVLVNKNDKPIGNQTEVLDVVLNRGETIDVQFYLKFPGRKDRFKSSYTVWIEEVDAPEVKVDDLEALRKLSTTEKKQGPTFFGIPID